MEHLQVATFKSIRDELLANTIETGAAIVQVYIPGVSEDTLCLTHNKYVLSEGYIENNDKAKGFVIRRWSGKSPDPVDYIGDQEVLYEDVNFRFKSKFNVTNCIITPDLGNTLLLGSDYKATVSTQTGYTITSVIVKVGETIVQSGTNTTINLTNILGDVEITAVATLNNYTINYVNIIDSDCVESTNTSRSIDHGLTYTTTIRKKEGYATLGPGSVTVGGVQMDSWNEQSGDKEISVVATGNIVIKVDECGDKYKYTAQLAQGLSNCVTLTGPTSNIEYGSTYRATLTHTAEYTNLGAITVTMGGNPVRTYPAGETQIDLVINGVNGNIVIDGECGTQETYSITLDKDCVTLVSPASPTNIQRGSDVHITLQKGQSYLNFGPGTISSPGKETIGIPSGITEFDTIINNVEGNITINIESCGDPIPTDYPVTINWVRQSDNQIIHTETQEHVQAGTTIHPEDYENDWDFSGYTEYEIKSMNPTRGTSIVVNEPKTIIYYCGLKDVPVSKYEVEVKYVTEESGQYVSIQGPTSDYTLGEYDEGTILVSNQQSIDTSNTNDYNFFSFDPATLTVSASSKIIYVVYIPKGNHTINYYNINNNGCVTNDKGTTSDSVAEGSSYSVTLTLDTDKYISAEVTISGSFTDTITLDSANPQRTVTFTVTTDTDITATCGQDREYTVTYNHIAGLSSSTGQQIVPSPLPTDSVTYGTTITISDLDNMRLSDQELNSYGYGTYINNSGYGYNNNSAGQETALTSTFTVTEDTTIYLYYSETPQGQIRFDYYIDDNLVTSQTVTEDVGTSVTLNDYKDLPSDIQNPEYYEFDSFDPDVQTITVNDSTQIVKVYYTTKKITLTFKYYDQMVSPPAAIDGVEPVYSDINMGSQYCETDFGEKKKTIEHYTYARSSLNGGCQTFTENSDIILYYNKKAYQITYRYINQESQEQLREDIVTTAPYNTTINLNTNKRDFDGYEFVDWNVDPETTIIDDTITVENSITITYNYVLAEEPCQPTCSLTSVAIQSIPNGYQVSSNDFDTPSDIIQALSNQVSIRYQLSTMDHEDVDSVSNLGWTIIIPDNVVVSSDPYTGQVIDCSCNSHDFTFYYGDYDPYIEVLIGCYNLNKGLRPEENVDYKVYASSSYQIETQLDRDETYVMITATSGGRSYTAYIPICPHFKVTLNYGNDCSVLSGEGDSYPWYGSECNFIVRPNESGKIVKRVTLKVTDPNNNSTICYKQFGSITSYDDVWGDEVQLSYGETNWLGTTQTDDCFEVTINETGDQYNVKFKNVQGDLYLEVQQNPGDCIKYVTYRHCIKDSNDAIVPIPGLEDSSYWVYGGTGGINIDSDYVSDYPEYENYKYDNTYITGTTQIKSSTTCDDNQQYDLVYKKPCEIKMICNYEGNTICEYSYSVADPPKYINLPTDTGSSCYLYYDYIIDSASSSVPGRNLAITSTKKGVQASENWTETFDCEEVITVNIIRDPDAGLKCYFNRNPKLIINRCVVRGEPIVISTEGHCYVTAERYKLFEDGRTQPDGNSILELTYAGDFDENGYVMENAKTKMDVEDLVNMNCYTTKEYGFSNMENGKLIIPYEGQGQCQQEIIGEELTN